MGFFKDLNEDVAEAEETLDETIEAENEEFVNIEEAELEGDAEAEIADFAEQATLDAEADIVDESLLENLFDESGSVDDEEEAEEEYDLGEETDSVKKEAPVARESIRAEVPDDDQVTVITKGTTINGSIVSDCSLNVMGTINGDIECIGKLTITGNVVGNSVASDVYVNAKRLDGNIDSEGTVKIGLGTVVVGDIKAGSGVIAGAVKGEVDVKGPVIIDSTAIIKGNVKAKSVQMNNGAVLEGFCSLAYASVDIDDIFE